MSFWQLSSAVWVSCIHCRCMIFLPGIAHSKDIRLSKNQLSIINTKKDINLESSKKTQFWRKLVFFKKLYLKTIIFVLYETYGYYYLLCLLKHIKNLERYYFLFSRYFYFSRWHLKVILFRLCILKIWQQLMLTFLFRLSVFNIQYSFNIQSRKCLFFNKNDY
jgi:hypothetical protein